MAASDEAVKFYVELVRALEWGERKEEQDVVRELVARFGVPEGIDDPASWLAANQPPEAVMGWLTASTAPFARMLSELYTWLADLRATVGGNVHEIAFDFASLQVRFSLDAFPKTYVQRWVDLAAVGERFEPAARGRVRVDVPNYWRDDFPALRGLLQASVQTLSGLPRPNQEAVAFRVRRLVEVLNAQYAVMPADVRANAAWSHGPLWVESEELWAELLARAPRSWRNDQLSFYQYMEEAREAGRIVDAGLLLQLLEEAERYGLGHADVPGDDVHYGPDEDADDTHAFLSVYALLFPRVPLDTRTLIDIVDKVLLPFWRHRWRLFEIWSVLWLRNVLPEPVRPDPCLRKRDGEPGRYSWDLPGGEAADPVAVKTLPDRQLSLWFQLKTPLSPADQVRLNQAHIEPDVRLRETGDAGERDLAILELKDRYLARGSDEKRVAWMYATTGAPVVCVANYSPFGAVRLRGKLVKKREGDSMTYLVDDFQPGSTPDEVAGAIRRTLGVRIDILVDVSGSMDAGSVVATLDTLPSDARSDARWFRWADKFAPAPDEASALSSFDHSGTLVAQAVAEHGGLLDARPALILTDSDGSRQFTALRERGDVDEHAYFCIDVAEPLDVDALEDWLSR
jgi:hypothetical protein